MGLALTKSKIWLGDLNTAKSLYLILLSSNLSPADNEHVLKQLTKIEKIELGKRLKKAIHYIESNQPQKAYQLIKQDIGSDHDSYRLEYVAAQSLAMLDKPKLALEQFNKALLLSHNNQQKLATLYGIAKMQYWLEQDTAAMETIQHMKQLANTYQLKQTLHQYLFKLQLTKSTKRKSTKPSLIARIRQAIAKERLDQALTLLKQYPNKKHYAYYRALGDVYYLLQDPRVSKLYYQAAYDAAQNQEEKKASLFGLGKSTLWLEEYAQSLTIFTQLMSFSLSKDDREVAITGMVISLNNLDWPTTAFFLVQNNNPKLLFKFPLSVVAAARVAINSGWAYKAKTILANNLLTLEKIPPGNYLLKHLREVKWLIQLQTSPGAMGIDYFTEKDSDEFRVIRKSLFYSYRFLGINSNTLFRLAENSYTFTPFDINATIFSITQSLFNIGDRLNINLTGSAARLEYQNPIQESWHPFLWHANLSYRHNDSLFFKVYNSQEIIESPPAMQNKLLFNTTEAMFLIHPLSRVFYRLSLFHSSFSDNNTRNGNSMALTYLLMRQVAFLVEFRYRYYRNSIPNNPFYFSPPKLDEKSVHLIFKRRLTPTWHVYAEGGIGRQAILPSLFDPQVSRQILSFDLNINGGLTDTTQMNVKFGYNQNAFNNFVGAYSRTYFGVNFKQFFN